MALVDFLKKLYVPFYLLVGYVFIVSGLIVCFLMLLTYIFVWPFNKALYRRIVTSLAYTHWCQMTFIAQWWSGSDFTLVVENPEDFKKFGTEHCMVVMNHRYDIEWIMTWLVAERFGLLGGTKIYGKSTLKMLPLIGWEWIFTESIFLKRDWEKDRRSISRDLQFITAYPKNVWVTLLMFCEGTRFTEEKHQASMAFARKKGIPELKHHLLPRTKGFVLSMNGLKGKMASVIDMTVAFDKNYAKPSFKSIIQGKKVRAEIFTRRIPLEDIPTDTDEACSEWLHELYRRKDASAEHYIENGSFKDLGKSFEMPRKAHDIIVWFVWAIGLSIPLVYYGMKIITSGSLTLQITTLLICFVLYKGVVAVLGVTETEKGTSEYGKVNGKAN